jgi:translation initiation factor IF-1
MVKNFGGNKAKGYARKNMSGGSHALRLSQDPAEVYAQTIKICGGSICRIIDLTGKEMTCHIRGKFRGRKKRDNLISPGTWLLVGLRDWEKEPSEGKLLNCDLIEVYSQIDKDRLKNIVNNVDWSFFITNDTKSINSTSDYDTAASDIQFSDSKTHEYEELIAASLVSTGKNTIITTDDGDEIDVDDI